MKNVFITGSNRGLGLELVKQYLAKGRLVIATCRDRSKAPDLEKLRNQFKSKLKVIELDLSCNRSIDQLSKTLANTSIDLYINNAGIMGSKDRELGKIDGDTWAKVFRVNTIAPILVVQALLKNIKEGSEKKMIFVSSRVGSIAQNTGGGMYSYRSSKTALNQVVKSLSIDLKEDYIAAIALHPGWVLTDMGGPNALIDVQTSVSGMISVIESSTFLDTGKFFNYDGSIINW